MHNCSLRRVPLACFFVLCSLWCRCFRFPLATSQRTSRLKCKRWSCPSSPIQTPSSSPCPLPTRTWPPRMRWNWLVRLIQTVGGFALPGLRISLPLVSPLHRLRVETRWILFWAIGSCQRLSQPLVFILTASWQLTLSAVAVIVHSEGRLIADGHLPSCCECLKCCQCLL